MTRANQAAIIAAVEYLSDKKTVCQEDASEAISAIRMIPTTPRTSISKNSRRTVKSKKQIPEMPVHKE